MQIQGLNLSPDAAFKIDGPELNASLLEKTTHRDGRAKIVTKDEDPGYSKVMRLGINKPNLGNVLLRCELQGLVRRRRNRGTITIEAFRLLREPSW